MWSGTRTWMDGLVLLVEIYLHPLPPFPLPPFPLPPFLPPSLQEAAWTISNITAGQPAQIQAVIDMGLIPPLVQIMVKVWPTPHHPPPPPPHCCTLSTQHLCVDTLYLYESMSLPLSVCVCTCVHMCTHVLQLVVSFKLRIHDKTNMRVTAPRSKTCFHSYDFLLQPVPAL